MVKSEPDIRARMRGVALFTACCISFIPAPSHAQSEEKSVLAEQTESFLGNRSSVGSLVGGILAGATFAHPFAPLAGTVVGFFVGKGSDFSGDENNSKTVAYRKSFAPVGTPDDDVSELALSGKGGQEPKSLELSQKDANPDTDLRNSGREEGVSELASVDEVTDEAGLKGEQESADELLATASETSQGAREPVHLVITKEVGGTQKKLDELAEIIREEQQRPHFTPHEQCPSDLAPRYRKRVAVAGFALENPTQTVFGGLGTVGETVSEMLYQQFRDSGNVRSFLAPSRQMFASLSMAPTRNGVGNRLDKYSAVSREMGVQFVVSGVIRDLGVKDRSAWGTSYSSKLKRTLFRADTERVFAVDVFVHDGYTGRVVMEESYDSTGRWDVPLTGKVGFGSAGFRSTEYGAAVVDLLAVIQRDVSSRIACQPMLVPILEVKGKDLLLDVGTPSGLLPGDRLQLVRAEHSLQRPDAPPELWDTGVDLHIHSLSLSTSRAWMHAEGGAINIREGDYAVIY